MADKIVFKVLKSIMYHLRSYIFIYYLCFVPILTYSVSLSLSSYISQFLYPSVSCLLIWWRCTWWTYDHGKRKEIFFWHFLIYYTKWWHIRFGVENNIIQLSIINYLIWFNTLTGNRCIFPISRIFLYMNI